MTTNPDWLDVAEHLIKRANEIGSKIDKNKLSSDNNYRQAMYPSITASLIMGELASALIFGIRGEHEQEIIRRK